MWGRKKMLTPIYTQFLGFVVVVCELNIFVVVNIYELTHGGQKRTYPNKYPTHEIYTHSFICSSSLKQKKILFIRKKIKKIIFINPLNLYTLN